MKAKTAKAKKQTKRATPMKDLKVKKDAKGGIRRSISANNIRQIGIA